MDTLQQLNDIIQSGKVDATHYVLSTAALGSTAIDALSTGV